ncbi:MAG: HAMP domain-containing histidine kinase [Clostridia bacterium]|nr:HAMP domain-containing histidine kinase [Clostridia bacterium]
MFSVSIKYKFIFFIPLLLLGAIVILSFFVLNGIKGYQWKETEFILIHQKNLFEEYLYDEFRENSGKEQILIFNEACAKVFSLPYINSIPTVIYNLNGRVVAKNGVNLDRDTKKYENTEKMMNYALKNKMAYYEKNGTVFFFSPVKHLNKTIGVISFEYSVHKNYKFYNEIKRLFYTFGIFVLIGGVSLGFFYMLSIARDILKMKKSVENIKDGKFQEIEVLKRKDELGDLSRGMLYMSKRIERNIKEIQKEKENLKLAVEKLKVMGEQQKEYIGNITHEFKTPLTVIKAYTDLLLMYDDKNLLDEAIKSISNHTLRLKNMVEKVLDLTALEKYDFEMEFLEMDLKKVLDEVCQTMMGKIRRHQLALINSTNECTIIGHEESIRHIFINLIDNAIKYNKPEGRIMLRNSIKENEVYVEIEDTGIGMDDLEQDRIFEPFYRGDKNCSREAGGYGLGLSLVKKLVEKHRGSIKVFSVLGRGTTLLIKLPLYAHNKEIKKKGMQVDNI